MGDCVNDCIAESCGQLTQRSIMSVATWGLAESARKSILKLSDDRYLEIELVAKLRAVKGP